MNLPCSNERLRVRAASLRPYALSLFPSRLKAIARKRTQKIELPFLSILGATMYISLPIMLPAIILQECFSIDIINENRSAWKVAFEGFCCF